MTRKRHRWTAAGAVAVAALVAGCGGAKGGGPLLRPETFKWVRQPIAFSPPPAGWERQGDNSGGLLGVRFILQGGGGQCISLVAFHKLAERDRRQVISNLIARRAVLSPRAFLDSLSLARARLDEPICDRERESAQQINKAIDRATLDYEAESMGFVDSDLRAALRAASGYEATLEELLPHILLRPERTQHPEWWRIGYERDTVVAGLPAFASDDTLIADGQTLLYHEVFWAVKGCAFKATFQGRKENLDTFHRVVDTIEFPEPKDALAAE